MEVSRLLLLFSACASSKGWFLELVNFPEWELDVTWRNQVARNPDLGALCGIPEAKTHSRKKCLNGALGVVRLPAPARSYNLTPTPFFDAHSPLGPNAIRNANAV